VTKLKLSSAIVLLVLGAAACSLSAPRSTAGKSTHAASTGPFIGQDAPQPAPASSLHEALRDLLSAEQRGDHAGSFVLLSDEARATYKDVHRWRDRRTELPTVAGYELAGKGPVADSLVAVVDHTAALDPFRGLSAARDRETWVGRQEHGGWVLDADPQTELLLPADSRAPTSAVAWAQAEQACDTAGAAAHQAVDPLLGMATAPAELCGHHVTFSAGPPRPVAGTLAAQDLIAQYTSDSLAWARVVTVTGADRPFEAVLAPIGDEWQVVGVYAAS
jgi:hypothetical protein